MIETHNTESEADNQITTPIIPTAPTSAPEISTALQEQLIQTYTVPLSTKISELDTNSRAFQRMQTQMANALQKQLWDIANLSVLQRNAINKQQNAINEQQNAIGKQQEAMMAQQNAIYAQQNAIGKQQEAIMAQQNLITEITKRLEMVEAENHFLEERTAAQ